MRYLLLRNCEYVDSDEHQTTCKSCTRLMGSPSIKNAVTAPNNDPVENITAVLIAPICWSENRKNSRESPTLKTPKINSHETANVLKTI